ncbi:endonuclease SmrB [Psychrosphaera ytuae]|nr:endonuclease SmrB [Psychrosphaera ytuae]
MTKKSMFNPFNESNNDELNNESIDFVDFAKEMAGVKKLDQNSVHFHQPKKKATQFQAQTSPTRYSANVKEKETARAAQRFHFSDQYEPYINENETLSFVREGYPSYLTKVLRRGDIAPDLILDLHGYTKQQAQTDLADLIQDCIDQHIPCACVVHGVSGGVLKRKVPHYLMQHPDVLAFHQAPLEWGGQGAIVLIVNLGEELTHILGRDL